MKTGALIAMGGLLGMIAPPTNIPAMIICGGIDMPYAGFMLPLAILAFPLAFLFILMLGYKYVRKMDYAVIEKKLDKDLRKTYGIRIYLPILVLLALMVVDSVIPSLPNVGTPVMFLIAAFVGLFTGKKLNILTTSKEGVKDVLPVMGILRGVGRFIQIMTLTGVRGLIVNTRLSLPNGWLFVAMASAVPAFGAISSFGSASVLGVPFTLAMISGNQVVSVAALSLLAAVGDMVPPTALAGIFAAQVVGEPKYTRVLKKAVIPIIILIAYSLIFIIFSKPIGACFNIYGRREQYDNRLSGDSRACAGIGYLESVYRRKIRQPSNSLHGHRSSHPSIAADQVREGKKNEKTSHNCHSSIGRRCGSVRIRGHPVLVS